MSLAVRATDGSSDPPDPSVGREASDGRRPSDTASETAGDLVVVANRLPIRRLPETAGSGWTSSPGGLVAALDAVVSEHRTQWVGWIGEPDDCPEPFEHHGISLQPVGVSAAEVDTYYSGFANATLWPLYHDAIFVPQFHRSWWEAYRTVNQRFAERVADVAAPGATVWIHDYHLQLVPRTLRELRPDLRIGFFLHIPFPSQELFMRLPWRVEVVRGLLAADVVGFQTRIAAQNFRQVVKRLVGLRSHGSRISLGDRDVLCEAFPVGIDAAKIEAIAVTPDCDRRVGELRESLGNPDTVVLGVDRLDYTKGIGARLNAFRELLEDGLVDPGTTVLVQIAEPSRDETPGYAEVRAEVEHLVGQINGDFGTMHSIAVKYLHQSQTIEELVALYRAADVMLVTPFRDGMNLVAKEYVAANAGHGGALVLSEFAGAAHQLTKARLVNPFDIASLKTEIARAINEPSPRSRREMEALARNVRRFDAAWWASSFMSALAGEPQRARGAIDEGDETTLDLTAGSTASVDRSFGGTEFVEPEPV